MRGAVLEYTFDSLSWIDFELLARDLVQADYSVTLEGFGPGRDGGIDFRCAVDPAGLLVVQCKHHKVKNAGQFVRYMVRNELPKVQRIKPDRYMIVCSQVLSGTHRQTLVDVFAPFLSSTADVLDRVRLNALLDKHRDVHDAHYKLWLPSTSVIQRILHADVYDRTRAMLESAAEKEKRLVESPMFGRALRILEEHGYCVIAGIPGIGKTTLAEMLVLHHVANGFEPVYVSDDIDEASRLNRAETPQLFYYDDFLGQSSDLDKMAKNEDARLAEFIRDVTRHKSDKRLVLTTRDYVLNQALARHERLDRMNLRVAECTLLLRQLTPVVRAHILFNHLAASSMPDEYVGSLLEGDTLSRIVGHRNYSPRVVEFMTTLLDRDAVSATHYPTEFLANLDNPRRLWQHAFRQITDSGRNLLLTLVTMPERCTLADLEAAFIAFNSAQAAQHNRVTSHAEFRDAMRELLGTFVSDERNSFRHVAEFQNPSIRDFLSTTLKDDASYASELLGSAVYFHQVVRLLHMMSSAPAGWPGDYSLSERARETCEAATAGGMTVENALWSLLHSPANLPASESEKLAQFLLERVTVSAEDNSMDPETAFRLARALPGSIDGDAPLAQSTLRAIKRFILRGCSYWELTVNYDRIQHWDMIRSLQEVQPGFLDPAEKEDLAMVIADALPDAIQDQVDVVDQNLHAYDALDEAADRLESLGRWLGVAFDAEVEGLHEVAQDSEQRYKERETERGEHKVPQTGVPVEEPAQKLSPEQLQNMFSALLSDA